MSLGTGALIEKGGAFQQGVEGVSGTKYVLHGGTIAHGTGTGTCRVALTHNQGTCTNTCLRKKVGEALGLLIMVACRPVRAPVLDSGGPTTAKSGEEGGFSLALTRMRVDSDGRRALRPICVICTCSSALLACRLVCTHYYRHVHVNQSWAKLGKKCFACSSALP